MRFAGSVIRLCSMLMIFRYGTCLRRLRQAAARSENGPGRAGEDVRTARRTGRSAPRFARIRRMRLLAALLRSETHSSDG